MLTTTVHTVTMTELKACKEAALFCWVEAHPALGAYTQGVATLAAAATAIGVSLAPIIRRELRLKNTAIQVAAGAVGSLEALRLSARTDPPPGVNAGAALDLDQVLAALTALNAFPSVEIGDPTFIGHLSLISMQLRSAISLQTLGLRALSAGHKLSEIAGHFDAPHRLANEHFEAMARTTHFGRSMLRSIAQSEARQPPLEARPEV